MRWPSVGLGLVLIGAIVGIYSCHQPGGAPRATPERLARLEGVVERLQRDLKIPGLSIAVPEKNELVWARGFGITEHADLRNRLQATLHG